ncbi:MAG: ABC transporter ATP-binding protein [Acidimicrobiales bacterium]|nr:ABC transporter ATP-binding protein [Acidimicrobiales bacterium]
MGPHLLDVNDLTVDFGGVRAIDGVSFTVAPGEFVGLIGPNGAGKTTTIDAITGFVAHRGRVHFAGTDITHFSPHKRAAIGLTRTWQSLELFEDLTIRENCSVAVDRSGFGTLALDVVRPIRRHEHEGVERALELLGIGQLADKRPSELSLGQRKLAAVARALAASPSMILLDEPAAGLDSNESMELGRHLREVVREGVTLLLVDHDMGLVLGVCSRLLVLDFGRLIASGPPSEIRNDTRVIEAYLGEYAKRSGYS